MALTVTDRSRAAPGFPQWIAADLKIIDGRDPLGLESITINRIVPVLIPGVLALSRRARYLSFHTFLLDHFHRRGGGSQSELSDFIRKSELDYALAVRLCGREGCGQEAPSVSGSIRAGQLLASTPATFRRAYSVESELGGYGLYYRTPLIQLGIVAPMGTPWQEDKYLKYDRIASDSGRDLAERFRSRIEKTRYFRRFLDTDRDVPADVLRELATAGCLCRLTEAKDELALVLDVLFGERAAVRSEADTRSRAFAFFLWLARQHPDVVNSEAHWRRRIFELVPRPLEPPALGETAASWAALMAKEYVQMAFSAAWTALLHWGIANVPVDGLPPADLRRRMREALAGPEKVFGVSVKPSDSAISFADKVERKVAGLDMETLVDRTWASPSCLAAVALILILQRRLPDPSAMPAGWNEVGNLDGDWQPGLLEFMRGLSRLLASRPTIAELVEGLMWKHIILAHHRLASAKLPYFTFRLRLEGGRVRFLRRLDTGFFQLADSRYVAMSLLSADLGLSRFEADELRVTKTGQSLISRVFPGA